MSDSEEAMTRDVEILLGHPKKALIAMAVPVMIANLIQSINNVIDTVWLTNLGVEAQAAVNVAFPLFFLMIGLGNGIGVGASQALARKIGAMDRKGANLVATQAIVMMIVLSLTLAIVFTLLAEPLLEMSGGASNMEACLAYSIPIFVGMPVILLGALFSALLRSEGAARRSMIIHVVGVIFNIILDPIFIFVLDMGVAGAAWATIIAMSIPIFIAIFWYYGNKSTFVRIVLHGFKSDLHIMWDILRVGIPASMEIALMSIVAMALNVIIEGILPVDGVAIYGNGWKIMDLFFMPTIAIGFAIVPICAAALGAKKAQKIRDVYAIAVKYGVVICIAISVILLIFADYLVIPFSYSEETLGLRDQMATFLRICAIFFPFTPLGYTSVGYFQAMGWGLKALSITAAVNLIRIPICLYLGDVYAELDMLWWGIVIAEIAGSVYGGIYGIGSIRKLLRGGYPQLLRKEDMIAE